MHPLKRGCPFFYLVYSPSGVVLDNKSNPGILLFYVGLPDADILNVYSLL